MVFSWDHCSDVLLIGQSDGFEFLHEDATVIAENVLAKQYTDTKGLFLGMFVAILSIELYAWLCRQKDCKSRCRKVFLPMSQQVFGAFPYNINRNDHCDSWLCYQSHHRNVCLRYHL